MSHVDPGPLATYESLADPHLTGYFNNTRMRKHLKRMGLITSRGEIVSEKVFRLNNARKEHQRHIRDVLAQAIVHKALDMERHRQMHIKKQLEEISKIERVRRVRAERSLRGDEDILPLLSPRSKQSKKQKVPILQTVADSSEDYEQRPPQSVGYPAIPPGPPYNTRAERMKMQYPDVEVDNQHLYGLDRDALRSFTLNLSQFDLGSGVSPYSVPHNEEKVSKKKKRRPATTSGVLQRSRIHRPRSNARSLRLHRREPPMMHRAQIHSLAKVTFKYLGQMVHLDHEEEDPRDEVVVMQQHCGGENICIFKGMVMKGDRFVVISRRHRTFPFSLTFYLNGVQVERLSTCCEYKHKTGHKLGAKSSHFGIVKVEGYQPCFKCLIAQGKLKTRPDPSPPPSGGRTKPSRQQKKTKKSPNKQQERADEYVDDFPESSKSSTTTDDVQPDGPKAPSETSSSEVSSDSSPLTSENESDDDTDTDTESRLPSLKTGNDSDSNDSESSNSLIKTKKNGRIKSTKSRGFSAGKKRIKSPPKERVKSPALKKIDRSNRTESPTPVMKETKSSPPLILKVEKSSSDASQKDETKVSSSLGSDSASSVTDAADTVEEVSNEKLENKKMIPDNRKDVLAREKLLPQETEHSAPEIPDRPLSPEPETSSDTSDAESVSTVSSGKESDSILPLIKGKWHIDLKDRKLASHQAVELTNYFNNYPGSLQIQELILSNCGIGNSKSKMVLKALQKSTSLKTLDLGGNRLTSDCVEDLLEVCYKNPVEHLNLANNPLKDKGCSDLVRGLSKSQANIITAKLQKKVSQSLIASVLESTKKEMSDEMASSISSASSMTSLASSAVSESVVLQSLNLANTDAGHETFSNLGYFLSLNPKLNHLNLSSNSISTTALELIIKPLANVSNKFLRSLVMDSATLDDRHAELLAKNLMMKSKLTGLSVKGNRITDVGKEKLEEYQKFNESLEKLTVD